MPGPYGALTLGRRYYDSPEPFPPGELFLQTTEFLVDSDRCQIGLLNRVASRPWTSSHAAPDGTLAVLHGHCFDPGSSALLDAPALWSLTRSEGNSLWDRLEGAFLFVLHEPAKARLQLVNDRLAILPTYWHSDSRRFCFAPRLRYLPRDLYHGSPDPTSIIHFLAIGKYPGTRTPLEGISLLGPATHLTVDLDDLSITSRHYWELEYKTEPETPTSHLVRSLGDAIDQSVDLMTGPQSGRGGIFLSGGWDSRAILGAALSRDRAPERVITNGVDDEIVGSDTWLARRMARDFDLPYYFSRREPEAGSERWLEGSWFSETATENSPGNFGIHRLPDDQFVGLDYMLKGDVTWGSGDLATDQMGVIDRNFPWPLGQNVLDVFSPAERAGASDRYVAAVESELERCPNDHPADRQQWLWQMSGINRYIFGLGYFDEEYIQIRRPLVTKLVLDQWVRVPWRLRINKNLFIETIKCRYPRLFGYGRNHVSHLADYYAHMAPFVRDRALSCLKDGGDLEGILDRRECIRLLEAFTPGHSSRYIPGFKARLRNRLHDRHGWRWHRTRFYRDNLYHRLKTSDQSLAFRIYLLLEWFHRQRR